MYRYRVSELLVATMPMYLFPVSFVLLREIFIISMAISTIAMSLASLLIMIRRGSFRSLVIRGGVRAAMISSLAATAILYAIFIAGGYVSIKLGMWGYVDMVYTSIIRSIGSYIDLLPLILSMIGTMEEIFWRGYIQGYMVEGIRRIRSPGSVILSSAYYALVHTPTLNPPLVVGALLVGLVTGYIATKHGVLGSIITHIVWLELIVVYAPATAILRSLGALIL